MFFLLEICLALVALGLAFAFPKLGDSWFSRWEERLARLARRRAFSVVVVGLSALAVRAALLPVEPVPYPGVQDEVSQLLAADTFAHGRLTNSMHTMWVHFESLAVLQQPTYASKYPVAPPLLMAAGQKIAGHPFWGVWFGVGLMCSAICWMLQGWLPETWALLGGFLAVIHFGAFSYWANSYWGGAVGAFAGALILGALPRIKNDPTVRYAIVMALGLAVLANTRPYEGLCFSIPILVSLLWWFFRQARSTWLSNANRIFVPLVLILTCVGAGMSYYCWRVTGSAVKLPYQAYEQAYDPVPYFIWQSVPISLPVYRHKELLIMELYRATEGQALRSGGFFSSCMIKLLGISVFYGGAIFGLLVFAALATSPRNLKWQDVPDKIRMLLVILLVSLGALMLEAGGLMHYIAQCACIIMALLLFAMRHLWAQTWRGKSTGTTLVRLLVACCLILVMLRAFASPLHISTAFPVDTWNTTSPQDGQNLARERIASQLDHETGKHLAFVQYSNSHFATFSTTGREWVYNAADIDASKVVWAQDMGPEKNQELIDYYKDRQVWLVLPDETPPRLLPYAEYLKQANQTK